MISTLFFSCENNDQTDQNSTADTMDAELQQNSAEKEAATNSLTITHEDFVTDPFKMEEISVQNLKKNFADFKIIEIQPYQNRHIPDQMDTIFTITAGKSIWKIYKTPSKDLLELAEVKSTDVALRQGIKFGMTTDELESALNISENLSPDAAVMIEQGTVPAYVELKFLNDRLQRIHFHGYVD